MPPANSPTSESVRPSTALPHSGQARAVTPLSYLSSPVPDLASTLLSPNASSTAQPSRTSTHIDRNDVGPRNAHYENNTSSRDTYNLDDTSSRNAYNHNSNNSTLDAYGDIDFDEFANDADEANAAFLRQALAELEEISSLSASAAASRSRPNVRDEEEHRSRTDEVPRLIQDRIARYAPPALPSVYPPSRHATAEYTATNDRSSQSSNHTGTSLHNSTHAYYNAMIRRHTETVEDITRRERLHRVLARLNRMHDSSLAPATSTSAYANRTPSPNRQSLYDWAPGAEERATQDARELETNGDDIRRQQPEAASIDIRAADVDPLRQFLRQAIDATGTMNASPFPDRRERLRERRRRESEWVGLRSRVPSQRSRPASPSATGRMLRYVMDRERSGISEEEDRARSDWIRRNDERQFASTDLAAERDTVAVPLNGERQHDSTMILQDTEQIPDTLIRNADQSATAASATRNADQSMTTTDRDSDWRLPPPANDARDRDRQERVDAFRRGYLAESMPSRLPRLATPSTLPSASTTTPHLRFLESALQYLGKLRDCTEYEEALSIAMDHGLATKEFFADKHDDFVMDLEELQPLHESTWLQPGAIFEGHQHATHNAGPLTLAALPIAATISRAVEQINPHFQSGLGEALRELQQLSTLGIESRSEARPDSLPDSLGISPSAETTDSTDDSLVSTSQETNRTSLNGPSSSDSQAVTRASTDAVSSSNGQAGIRAASLGISRRSASRLLPTYRPTVPPPIKTSDTVQDHWPVRVIFHSVNLDKMIIQGTMEAYDVPRVPSSLHTLSRDRPKAGRKSAPITTYVEGHIIDLVTHSFLTPSPPVPSKKTESRSVDCSTAISDSIAFPSANAMTDAQNWRELPPFNQLATSDAVARALLSKSELSEICREYIFMRWKEKCFVHAKDDACRACDGHESRDDRDRGHGLTISGFYYVSVRRADGLVDGLYFDPSSTPYQHLRLQGQSHGWPAFETR